MTTLADRPNTALIVIDVQNGVVAGTHDRDGVVANINALVDKARAEDVPVVWVQHSDDGLEQDSEDWRIVAELSPGDGEPVVQQELRRLLRGHRPRGRSSPAAASAGSSSPARRPTPASAPPCTGPWSAATTSPWSATRTPPRTSPSTARRRPDLVISHTNLYWQWAKRAGRGGGDVVATARSSFGRARPDDRCAVPVVAIDALQRNPKAGRVKPKRVSVAQR